MKLPEPACTAHSYGRIERHQVVGYANSPENLYTEVQLKQAVRDALEAAAVTAWSHYLDTCKANRFAPADNEKWLCATAIRKLMEGI
jgi:hypothetical protein